MLNNHDKLFPRVKFDMATWGDVKNTDRAEKRSAENKPHLVSCTTAACAAGSACIHKPFMQEGLRFKYVTPGGFYQEHFTPAYNGMSSWDALSEFFGIEFGQTRNLFDPSTYDKNFDDITPKHVAQRVRELLKTRAA